MDKGNCEVTPGSDTRTLNVELPASVYWHVRTCATESRMSMKDFMAIFCQNATAIETQTETAGRLKT
jgi:hypothetical protein